MIKPVKISQNKRSWQCYVQKKHFDWLTVSVTADNSSLFIYLFVCLSAGFGSRHEWFAGNIDQVKITNANVPYCQVTDFKAPMWQSY
jgi:hypothetical protein